MPSRSPVIRNLIVGAAVALPVVIIILLLQRIYGIIASLSSQLIYFPLLLGFEGVAAQVIAVIGGIAFAIFGLIVLGIFVRNQLGGSVLDFLDRNLVKIPVLGPVYRGLSEARAAFVDRSDDEFDDVVLVDLGNQTHVLAFVTGSARSDVQSALSDSRVAVFVPLSPNPTLGGHTLFVSEDRLISTSLSIREAVTAIVTLGAGQTLSHEPPVEGLYHSAPESSDSSDED